MQTYQMKDSGIEWLGSIPNHWNVNTLKNKFQLKPSNVDKKTHDDETAVQLCNYVDVYYNDFITNDLPFMEASATEHEINKFSLVVDDVIITKDSEDPMDIGVPALVRETKDNLVCGYHLTMIKKRTPDVSGAFLFWCLKDSAIASQLYREATGVTRWAISSRNIKNITLAFPSFEEQKAIADYLNQACSKIDETIAIKQQQLDTLEAYRKSIIHEAVTKGLDKTVEMKDSGVEWFGDIPSHWKLKKLTQLTSFTTGFTPSTSNPSFYEGKHNWVTIDDLNEEKIVKTKSTITDLAIAGKEQKIAPKGSLLYSFKLSVGKTAIAENDVYTNEAIAAFRPSPKIDMRYFKYSVEDYLIFNGKENIYGATLLNRDLIRTSRILYPELKEQKEIADYLDQACLKIDDTKETVSKQIETLKEYRKSLIHECVTGKKRVYQGKVA